MWQHMHGAMDGPAIKGSMKGDQMWQYIQCNGWSSLQGGPNVAVFNAMNDPAIKGSKEDQMW